MPSVPHRPKALAALSEPFDVLVLGGGATGLGIALDAVSRGFRTALVEAGDFAQATSSRATKLVHGGVRYLASGQVHLVYEALHEREVMRRNAPHLVHAQGFLLPAYRRFQLPWYGAGLMLYDLISGRASMGRTRLLGRKRAQAAVHNLAPALNGHKLRGGVLYFDGQFNDARFALALARTAVEHGAAVLNYTRCTRLLKSDARLTGAVVVDGETGAEHTIHARAVFNATGIFVDQVRQMDDPASVAILTHSRGTHIVVAGDVLGGTAAIMVPETPDGRVIFAVPWEGRVLIGTTDLPAPRAEMEPGYSPDEIGYLLDTVNPYLARPLSTSDILSVFSGLRPLVRAGDHRTSKLSREHSITLSPSGLVTVAGGKWTTYRRMAEDALDFAMRHKLLAQRPCRTARLPLQGAPQGPDATAKDVPLREYGADAAEVLALVSADPTLATRMDPALPYTFAQVVYAVRAEMARTLEDVLSRRTRALLLDSRAALRAAPAVAAVMARELGHGQAWQEDEVARFTALADADYVPPGAGQGRSLRD